MGDLFRSSFYFLFLSCLLSCAPDTNGPEQEQTFLFLGHTYDWQDVDRLDPRLHFLDFSRYTGVWLGGDVLARTLRQEANLLYLDSLIDLSRPTNHWARGNHDEMGSDSLQWLDRYTHRPGYYLHCAEALCVLVLNTNLFYRYAWGAPTDRCSERAAQLALIQSLPTQLTAEVRNLVVLHHQTLPIVDAPEGTAKNYNVDPPRTLVACDTALTYLNAVYPIWKELLEKQITITCVGGDLGVRAKRFAYRSRDGIQWLGAGMNNSVDPAYAPEYVKNYAPDSALIVQYQPTTYDLTWHFASINELVLAHTGRDSLPPNLQKFSGR